MVCRGPPCVGDAEYHMDEMSLDFSLQSSQFTFVSLVSLTPCFIVADVLHAKRWRSENTDALYHKNAVLQIDLETSKIDMLYGEVA